jgi:hypothetical protein
MVDSPQTITVPEAGRKYLGLSRNGSYAAASRGQIPVIQIGRLKRVPIRAMEAMLDRATPREPAAWFISPKSISKKSPALAVLKGFHVSNYLVVEVTQRGRASFTAEYRHPSRYRLTYRPTEDGEQTDEWERIKTLEDAEKIARGARLTPKRAKRQALKQHPNPGAKTAPKVDAIAGPQNSIYKLGAKMGATSIFSGDRRYNLMQYVGDVVRGQLDGLKG